MNKAGTARKAAAGRKRAKTPMLDSLQPEEAARVLRKLIDSNPKLRAEAEGIARSLLSEQGDFEVLADGLEWELGVPGIDEMKRQIDLGLEANALETCKGILLGLYRFAQGGQGLVDWAPDYPAQTACDVAKVWVTGDMEGTPPPGASSRRKLAEFPRKFLDDFVADWKVMLSRHLCPDKESRGKSPTR